MSSQSCPLTPLLLPRAQVTKLCDLGNDDLVTSVSWTQRGTHLAVGTNAGEVQIWDAAKCKKVRMMEGHSGRVGTMAWNHHTLASGSRDRLIFQRDVRAQQHFVSKLVGHKQEVCGLKWSCDDMQLASGGNDNKLLIWNVHSQTPVMRFNDHTAAVKAIAWSPHQHGLLASGGGTADRCIRFWNTLTGSPLNCIDTGSQVHGTHGGGRLKRERERDREREGEREREREAECRFVD